MPSTVRRPLTPIVPFWKWNSSSFWGSRRSSPLSATMQVFSSSFSFCRHLWCLVCWAWAKCLFLGSLRLTSATSNVNGLSKPVSLSKGPALAEDTTPSRLSACPKTPGLLMHLPPLVLFYGGWTQEIKWGKTTPTALLLSTACRAVEGGNGRNPKWHLGRGKFTPPSHCPHTLMQVPVKSH